MSIQNILSKDEESYLDNLSDQDEYGSTIHLQQSVCEMNKKQPDHNMSTVKSQNKKSDLFRDTDESISKEKGS